MHGRNILSLDNYEQRVLKLICWQSEILDSVAVKWDTKGDTFLAWGFWGHASTQNFANLKKLRRVYVILSGYKGNMK